MFPWQLHKIPNEQERKLVQDRSFGIITRSTRCKLALNCKFLEESVILGNKRFQEPSIFITDLLLDQSINPIGFSLFKLI